MSKYWHFTTLTTLSYGFSLKRKQRHGFLIIQKSSFQQPTGLFRCCYF